MKLAISVCVGLAALIFSSCVLAILLHSSGMPALGNALVLSAMIEVGVLPLLVAAIVIWELHR